VPAGLGERHTREMIGSRGVRIGGSADNTRLETACVSAMEYQIADGQNRSAFLQLPLAEQAERLLSSKADSSMQAASCALSVYTTENALKKKTGICEIHDTQAAQATRKSLACVAPPDGLV
jgi:hypothetical protein